VAAGDVTGDGTADIVTGAGPGGGPHVKVFNGHTNAEVHSFFAFTPSFSGGVYVAAGDVTGDFRADLITGAGSDVTHVKVFDGGSGAEIRSFFAFAGATLPVRVAAGDVNGDGYADIVAGTGPGGGHVKVFDGVTSAEIRSFLPYGSYTGGVFVAAGDVNGDGHADLVTGTDDGVGGGHVRVFDGVTTAVLHSFFAYGGGFTGGVRVATGDVTGDGFADIITGSGVGAGHVKVFDASTGAEVRSFLAYGSFNGGVFVAGEVPIPEPGYGAAILLGGGFAALRRRLRSNTTSAAQAMVHPPTAAHDVAAPTEIAAGRHS
jgi:hypothetical protein